MNLNALKVIVIACQIAGSSSPSLEVENKQSACQAELINCVEKRHKRLDMCLYERGKSRYPNGSVHNESSLKAGKRVYAANCSSCHGNKAQGSVGIGAPMLARQHAWYLKNQILDIRDGKRTNGKANLMVSIFKRLSEEDIDNVTKYLEKLKCRKKK